MTRTCADCQDNLRRAEASAAHATEFQAHVAALEERISNPLDKQTTSGSIENAFISIVQATSDRTLNNAIQRSPTRGSTLTMVRGPLCLSVNSKGSTQKDFCILSCLAPFSGNTADGEALLNSFIACSRLCSDKESLYWFRILYSPVCTLWFERTKFLTWEAACRAFQTGYTICIQDKEELQLSSALNQPNKEPVASYNAWFERKLGNVYIKSHKDLFINALFEKILPILLILGAHSTPLSSLGESLPNA